jgi:hypothetical protein
MLSSPFADVEIPGVALDDFVLDRAEELRDKPALIEASSGRAITCAQLSASVNAVAAGLARDGEAFHAAGGRLSAWCNVEPAFARS